MRSILYALLFIGVGLTVVSAAHAQTRVRGQVYALLYARENIAGDQLWDTYEGLRLDVRPRSDLSLKTNVRVARRGNPADWDERIYNAYLDWDADRRVQVRLGRQFFYRGVINGSLDALSVRAQPTPKFDVQVVGGLDVPFDRPLDVTSWSEGGTLGGYAAYEFVPKNRLDVSYVQRLRGDEVAWQQAGAALRGAWRQWSYLAQFDYNLQASMYQGMRYRLAFRPGRWGVSGEFNSQKLRILEDSFFNVFELVAFDQLRGGVTYQAGRYVVGAQYLHTIYEEDDTSDEVLLSFGTPWGTVGATYQTGYGGENVGVFGEVRYAVLPNLTARLHSSHYTYERRNIAFDEDATAFSGGVHYRPLQPLLIQAEVQESMNSRFDNDLRLLLRVNYTFNLR